MGVRLNFIDAVDNAESYREHHPDQHESIAQLMGKAVDAARRLLDSPTMVHPVPDSDYCYSLEERSAATPRAEYHEGNDPDLDAQLDALAELLAPVSR